MTTERTESPASGTAPLLQLQGLSKTFRVGLLGRQVQAVRDVTLDVFAGQSVGYLGPNGSGKTTSIKCILGLIAPSKGEIRLFGRPGADPMARAKVGYLPESPYFYDYLTPTEVLEYVGKLYGIAAKDRARRIPMLLDRVGLTHAAGRPLRGFSKGMLQRVGLAQSLVADPDLLIYDEPMSGLDPIGRKEVRELMAELRAQGKTLFFSSHVLADVEALCDSVCILDSGKVVAQGRLSELLRTDQMESEAVIELPLAPMDRDAVLLALQGLTGATVLATVDRARIVLPTDTVSAMNRLVDQHGARLRELSPRRDTLEELFVRKAVHRSDGSDAATVPSAQQGTP
jgi:ABC-2 type transport system ATP-binding protein